MTKQSVLKDIPRAFACFEEVDSFVGKVIRERDRREKAWRDMEWVGDPPSLEEIGRLRDDLCAKRIIEQSALRSLLMQRGYASGLSLAADAERLREICLLTFWPDKARRQTPRDIMWGALCVCQLIGNAADRRRAKQEAEVLAVFYEAEVPPEQVAQLIEDLGDVEGILRMLNGREACEPTPSPTRFTHLWLGPDGSAIRDERVKKKVLAVIARRRADRHKAISRGN